jgi:hypothetical protein
MARAELGRFGSDHPRPLTDRRTAGVLGLPDANSAQVSCRSRQVSGERTVPVVDISVDSRARREGAPSTERGAVPAGMPGVRCGAGPPWSMRARALDLPDPFVKYLPWIHTWRRTYGRCIWSSSLWHRFPLSTICAAGVPSQCGPVHLALGGPGKSSSDSSIAGHIRRPGSGGHMG